MKGWQEFQNDGDGNMVDVTNKNHGVTCPRDAVPLGVAVSPSAIAIGSLTEQERAEIAARLASGEPMTIAPVQVIPQVYELADAADSPNVPMASRWANVTCPQRLRGMFASDGRLMNGDGDPKGQLRIPDDADPPIIADAR